MKRNFLLMLLLTLLPLAGLAQTLSFSSATYDGSSHSLPTASIGGNTIPVSTSTYVTYNSYRYRINHWTKGGSTLSGTEYEDAGTYIANVQRRSDGMFGSWADYTTLTLTVNKGTNTVSPDPTISGWKYGTTPVSPSGSAAKWGFVEYQYSANGTDGWGDYATVVNGESGDYYVSAYVAGTDNYNEVRSAAVPFSISPSEVTVKVFGINKVWDTPWTDPTIAAFNADATLRQVTGDAGWDAVKGYLTFSRVDEGTDVGSYQYTLKVDPSAGKNLLIHVDNAAGKLNITQATNVINSVTVASWTYGDAVTDPTDKITVDAKYGAETATFEFFEGSTSLGSTIPTDAGDYSVEVTIPEPATANYTEVKYTQTFTIAKATIASIADLTTGAWKDYFTVPTAVTEELTYTEDPANTPKLQTLETAVEMDAKVFADADITYIAKNSNGYGVFGGAQPAKASDADTYKLTFQIKNAKNFNDFVLPDADAITKEIKKADLTPAAAADQATKIATGLEYTGVDQKLLTGAAAKPKFMGVERDGEFTYFVDDVKVGTDWNGVVGKNADEKTDAYVITYKFEPASTNFNAITVQQPIGNANIAKAFVKRTGSPAVVSALTYNADDQKLLQTGKYFSGIEGGHVIYYAQGTKETDATEFTTYSDVKKKDNDTYTVSYKFFADDDNHKDDEDVTEIGSVLIDKYEVMVVGNEIKGTIEELYDLTAEPVAPKFANAQFLEDITLLGPDNANRTEILNAIVTPNIPAFDNLKLGDNTVTFTATPEAENNTNYKAKVVGTAGGRLNIQSIEAAIQEDAEPKLGMIYNGADQELIGKAAVGYKAEAGTGTVAIGKVVYCLTEAGEYTDDVTKIVGKDADKYTVYYKVELDKDNVDRFYTYTAAVKSFTATIDQKPLADEMFVLTPTEAVYNGENQLPVMTTVATEPITTDDWDFAVADGEGNPIADPNTGVKDVDNYAITFTGKANYKGTAAATFKITKAAATAEAPAAIAGLVYNGKNQALVTAPAYSGGTIKYSLNGTYYTYEDVPAVRDADDYTVYYMVEGDKNHTDFVCTEPVEVSIGKKQLTEDMFVFPDGFETTFNGKYQYLKFDVAEFEAEIMDSYICLRDDMIIDAGIYPHIFKGQNNYEGTFTVNYVVKPKPQDIVEPKAVNLTYNGTKQTPIEAGSTDAEGVRYAVNDGEFGEVGVLPEIKDAGKYTIRYEYVADKNYLPADAGEVEVEIRKANIAYELSNLEKVWDGETFTPEQVEKLFTLYVGKLYGDDEYDQPFVLKLPEDYKDAGTYTFQQAKYEFKEGYPENYKINFSGTAEVVIDKKDIADEDYTAPTKTDDIVYDGTNFDLVTNGEVTTKYEGEPIGEICFFKGETAPEKEEDWSTTVPSGKDAGDYTVWYYVKGDKNHNDTDPVKIENTIAPKGVTFSLAFEDATGDKALTYNTKDQMPADIVAKDGDKALVKGTDYTMVINYTPANATEFQALVEPKLVNVGKYEFKYTGINNYEGSEATRTIVINPADLADVAVVTINGELIKDYEPASVKYTSKDQKPNLGLRYEGAILAAETDYEVAAEDEMINAGEYEFTFTAVAGGNYTGETTATFTVTPLEVIVEAANATKVYDGEEGFDELPELTFNGVLENEIALVDDIFDFDATAFTFAKTAKNVGTYAFEVVPEEITATNYEVTGANGADFTITPAPLVVEWNDEAEPFTKVYGEADPTLTATADNVDVTGAVNAEEEEAIINLTKITRAEGEAVGKYAVTLSAKPAVNSVFANYEVEKAFPNNKGKEAFVITEATVKVSIAALEKVYDGEAATIEVAAENLVVTGLKNGDKKEDIFSELPTATVADGKAVNVGTYQVTLAGGKAADYVIELIPSTFDIVPATITTATIASQQIKKGQDVEENIDATAFTIEGVIAADADKFYVTVNDKYQDFDGKVSADKGIYNDGLVIAVDDEVADNYTGYDKFFGELRVLPAEAMVIADNEDWKTEAKHAEAVTFTDRAINAGNWNVVALPFETTVKQVSDAFGYAAVDVLNETASDGSIHFQVISSGVIPAYTPFIVKTTEDEDLVKDNFNQVVFEDVDLEPWTKAENSEIKDAANNKFIGTFKAVTEIPAGSKAHWYMSKGTWYDTANRTKAVNLKAFRAYVEFDPANVAAGARIYIEEPDGTETSIDAIEFNQMVNGDNTYTVDGKKVSNTAQKGVYIQNGKKVAVK